MKTPRSHKNLCKQPSWHDTNKESSIHLLMSKHPKSHRACEAAGPITPQDRPQPAYCQGRRFSLRAPLAQQQKSHPFRRSYRVFSSNSDQSHSCQTRVPYKQAAAAAASAPSGDLNHRQTNKGGSPEGPGDFFPTRPQPPSALKHDAAPPALPPAYLLASDSRDSVEIKLLHAP